VGEKELSFPPSEVKPNRPDLFNPGFFSMFDVIAHLGRAGEIDLEYHYDEPMRTHVIDAINGESGWWYEAHYSGGRWERNAFRPDHYPWQDGSSIRFLRMPKPELEIRHSIFSEEVRRLEENGGRLIVPEVNIEGLTSRKRFTGVEVEAQGVRGDVLRPGVPTVVDVMLSLADRGEIRCELQWHESIGRASIVKTYFVESIDDERARGLRLRLLRGTCPERGSGTAAAPAARCQRDGLPGVRPVLVEMHRLLAPHEGGRRPREIVKLILD
jgi:hypothetical protein